MCHEGSTPRWWRLAPNPNGDYAQGTWSRLADLPNIASGTYAPLYFASAILRDGRVFVAGGEYNSDVSADVLAAMIYDPVTNTWTVLSTPTGWTAIGDAPSCVLADGRLLLGSITDNRVAIYDPDRNAWSAAGSKRNTCSTEETWTLLPDGSVS